MTTLSCKPKRPLHKSYEATDYNMSCCALFPMRTGTPNEVRALEASCFSGVATDRDFPAKAEKATPDAFFGQGSQSSRTASLAQELGGGLKRQKTRRKVGHAASTGSSPRCVI
eukprot:2060856-Amphidinium_carterae.1